MKKLISVLICLALAAALFSGCHAKEKKIDLIYPFSGSINSYDPQVAATSDEFLVAENCFEGLVRCDDEGNITAGCASSWQVSEDGLNYTFHLQKGLNWYIFPSVKEKFGEDYNPEITAADFVFALQRAADGATASPLYSTISCIENAPAVNSGSEDKSALGVRADDDYTLSIRLSAPNGEFLQVLSTAVAMPCNEEFFNSTNGRYGLDLKYTMFNGQFVVTNQLEQSYVLKNNPSYKGPTPAKAADLTLKIVDGEESLAEKLISGYYDAAFIRGYESEEVAEKSGVTLIPYVNTTWAFIFNPNYSIFASEDARHAFTLSVSPLDYEAFPYLSDAKSYIPPCCTAEGSSYADQISTLTEQENGEEAVALWKKAVKDTEIYSAQITLLAPENTEEAAKALLQGVQSSIGAISNANGKNAEVSLKLELVTESELKTRIAIGDYNVALYPLTAANASPVSFLQDIYNSNFTGLDEEEFSELIGRANAAAPSELAAACAACESSILEQYRVAPLFHESNYYAEAKGVSGVQFHPGSGRVSFIYADREN